MMKHFTNDLERLHFKIKKDIKELERVLASGKYDSKESIEFQLTYNRGRLETITYIQKMWLEAFKRQDIEFTKLYYKED